MAYNTLAAFSSGEIIRRTYPNQFFSSVTGDFVPRNSSTGTVQDLAGDLGTTTYRWNETHANQYVVGATSSNLQIKENISNNSMHVGTDLTDQYFTLTSVLSAPDDCISTASMKTVSTGSARGNLATSGEITQNGNLAVSASYTHYSSFDITLATGFRPVILTLDPANSTSDSYIYILPPSGSTVTFWRVDFKIVRNTSGGGSTDVEGFTFRFDATNGTGGGCYPQHRFFPGHIFAMDKPSTGTHTYELWARVFTSDVSPGNMDVNILRCALKAFEL